MAGKDHLDQIKAQFERLRKDSLESVANANRIVYEGVQKLADKELKALNDYYRLALLSIKRGKKSGDSFKDIAQKQIELLQMTATKVLANARESLAIVAKTRAELAALVDKSIKTGSVPNLAQVTKPAKQAIKDVKAAALKARKQVDQMTAGARKAAKQEVQKDLKKAKSVVGKAKAALDKVQAQTEAKASEVRTLVGQTLGSVLDIKTVPVAKKSVSAKPSPTSRASRATSKAKKTGTAAPKKRASSAASSKPASK